MTAKKINPTFEESGKRASGSTSNITPQSPKNSPKSRNFAKVSLPIITAIGKPNMGTVAIITAKNPAGKWIAAV